MFSTSTQTGGRSDGARDGGTYPQQFQYIPYSGGGSPFGFNGRFLYARVGVDF